MQHWCFPRPKSLPAEIGRQPLIEMGLADAQKQRPFNEGFNSCTVKRKRKKKDALPVYESSCQVRVWSAFFGRSLDLEDLQDVPNTSQTHEGAVSSTTWASPTPSQVSDSGYRVTQNFVKTCLKCVIGISRDNPQINRYSTLIASRRYLG